VLKNDVREYQVEALVVELTEVAAVAHLKADVRALGEALTGSADHFGRDVDAGDASEATREVTRHAADAAADLQHALVAGEQKPRLREVPIR
jgi:hypothetical protein